MPLEMGLVQVYYGEGKGKTTAALGLALRAVGQGLRVYIAQFLKPRSASSGEANIISRLGDDFVLERINENSFLGKISEELRAKSTELFARELPHLKNMLQQADYDLIILDEILNVLSLGLIKEGDLLELLEAKHPQVELILTGRQAPAWLLERADLATEIRLVKHPYQHGIKARRGIEF